MNKFKIIFLDTKKNLFEVTYRLHDTIIAKQWSNKLKHIYRVPIDPIESEIADFSNLREIYKAFCDFAEIDPPFQISDRVYQNECNLLHKIYEENHNRLSVRKGNDILYKFHHAIHDAESVNDRKTKDKVHIGWGIKEGPLTTHLPCNKFYEAQIKKNNLYLPWAELGKKPYTYWINKEPKDQSRFNALCKPHMTFRAKCFVALRDKKCTLFPNQFNQYFNQFKKQWLRNYDIDDWSEKDEMCAPLLAHTDCTTDLSNMSLKEIVI